MQERISNRHGQIPTQVGVVGGGQMGSGIAHAFLVAGSLKVIVVEIDHTAAQQAIERICGALQKVWTEAIFREKSMSGVLAWPLPRTILLSPTASS